MKLRVRIAIVGAGPAGLLLGHPLAVAGIDFVIVELRSREYILGRIRAGVLEESSVEVFANLGLNGRLQQHGLVHDGIYLRYGLDGRLQQHGLDG